MVTSSVDNMHAYLWDVKTRIDSGEKYVRSCMLHALIVSTMHDPNGRHPRVAWQKKTSRSLLIYAMRGRRSEKRSFVSIG